MALTANAEMQLCSWVVKSIPLRQSVLLGRIRVPNSRQCKQFNSMNGHGMPRLDYTVDQDVVMSNWMIAKLSKESRIFEAQKLFDRMPDPDVISWTTLITGYVKCGMMKRAKELFDRADAKKNVATWTSMINGYMKKKMVFEAERLFYQMPEKNVFSWNTMIDGYVKCGAIDKALRLFEMIEHRNVVSGNMIIAGLAKHGRIQEAKEIFDRMPVRNLISWTSLVAGLCWNGRVDDARILFEMMPERNVVSWNAMITGYMQNLRLSEAFDLFERMPEKDTSSWNTMITGFIQNRDLQNASRLFNEMPEKNVISWTTMINGYAQDNQGEEALRVFLDMLCHSTVKPNEGTFVSVLGACSDLAGLGEGKQIHQVICKTVHHKSDFLISALISMYSKCGELLTARKVFDDGVRGQKDLACWNSMITSYAHHGCGREAINLFDEMQNMGLKPNDVTYMGLLVACSYTGLVEDGFKYFDMLANDKSVMLREDHYTCLIDLCGRAGRFKEALDFIEQLPTKPSARSWGAFLAGCNVYGNSDIPKLVTENILKAEPEDPGSYMILSSIYAHTERWNEAAKLRAIMNYHGLKKQPGCSWIDIRSQVHVFVVDDTSHSEVESIHSLLETLHTKMKAASHALAETVL